MIIRVAATLLWISIAALGVHMMRNNAPYMQWAGAQTSSQRDPGVFESFAKDGMHSMGPTTTGRILTILGSCMIAGTWYPVTKRKKSAVLMDTQHLTGGDDRILMGEVADEPHYEFKV